MATFKSSQLLFIKKPWITNRTESIASIHTVG